jgi:hypothetical protein
MYLTAVSLITSGHFYLGETGHYYLGLTEQGWILPADSFDSIIMRYKWFNSRSKVSSGQGVFRILVA